MSDSLVVARPESPPQQLFLLVNGGGVGPEDLLPLGQALATEFPQALVASVAAPWSDAAGTRSWFDVDGVTEANRPGRVDAAMPAFVALVEHWRRDAGVPPEAVALVGFSQGAIMVLEASNRRPALAGRLIAIAGRFARLPEAANPETTLHLFHGKDDPVIPYAATVEAAKHLVAIGADLTADVLPRVGHQVDDEVTALLVERLRGHLPRRTWEAALRAARDLQEAGDGEGS